MSEDKLIKTNDCITQDKRDSLMYFNTVRYWHCWYDIENNKLYDEYGYCRNHNAKEYLRSIGVIDEENNKLFNFEEDVEG